MRARRRDHLAQLNVVTTVGAKGDRALRSKVAAPCRPAASVRPDANTLDLDIPLFLVGKNKDGFWVAREENNCAGGISFTEAGARQFATHWAKALGCATMRASEPLELGFNGEGNVPIPLLAAPKSRGVCGMPEPALDAMVIVLGLAAVALSVWLVVTMLTLGT